MTENHTTASEEAGHGSVASYIVGYVLSIILTVIAFYIVMEHMFSTMATATTLGYWQHYKLLFSQYSSCMSVCLQKNVLTW